DYSMMPGLASATFAVVMNQATYDSLPPEQQALIDETTGPDRAEAFGAMWDAGEEEGRQYLLDGGVEIVQLPDAEFARLRERLQPMVDSVIDTVEAAGKPGRALFEAYTE